MFKGHLMARDMYVDGSSFPTFPLGVYMFSLTIIESFPDHTEQVGIVKYYIEVMEKVKSKKKNSSLIAQHSLL